MNRETWALREACHQAGLDWSGATLIRRHANATYRLPAADAVGRVGGSWDASARAHTGVAVTRWLLAQGFPTVEPLDIDQPIEIGRRTVTFWRYCPPHPTRQPSARDLARLLRGLHALPPPPLPLPGYEPLQSFASALTAAGWLADKDRRFLEARRQQLLDQYARLDFVLPPGLIHGDADVSNLLQDNDTVRLADWDTVCIGPREQDLAITHQDARFGLPATDREAFAAEYGCDVTAWPGYSTLRDIHELHTLTSFLRIAATDPPARQELMWRLQSLRAEDHQARWVAY